MLREKVVAGSAILTIRAVLGFVISVIGSIFILRMFDLKTYGLYAIGIYWIAFLSGFVYFGIQTYLARTQEDITDRLVGAAFTLFITQAVIGVAFINCILSPLLSKFHKDENICLILNLLSISYIFTALGKVSLSLLERDLDYKKLGIIELASQFFFYIPAIIGALMGLGIFALIVAELLRALFTSIMAFLFRRIKFRLIWDRELSLEMLRYGFGITTSSGIFVINAALVPIMVGRMAGTEAVGIIRVTQNLVGQLSFLKSISWRISIPVFGKIQKDTQKVVKAVTEGSLYQNIFVALPLFGFVSIGYWLVPLVYGKKWEPVSAVIVLACLPVAVNAIFSLQASALYAVGKNLDVAKWTTVYTLSLWSISFLTISKFGYIGLPLAEILVLPTYYVQHWVFKKHFGNPEYKDIFVTLATSYTAVVLAWFIGIPWMSIIVFTIPTLMVILTCKSSKHLILELFHSFKNGALWQSLLPVKTR